MKTSEREIVAGDLYMDEAGYLCLAISRHMGGTELEQARLVYLGSGPPNIPDREMRYYDDNPNDESGIIDLNKNLLTIFKDNIDTLKTLNKKD